MPLIPIDTLDDDRLLPFRHLKKTNRTRWARWFVAEGWKLLARLIESDWPLHSVLLGQTQVERLGDQVPPDVPVYVVPDDLVHLVVGFNFHYGVLACAWRREPPSLNDILPLDCPRWTLVVCPDVQDPDNLGAIFRISRALGADAVLLGKKTPDRFSRRILRVSMGASFQLPAYNSPDLAGDLARLRDEHHVQLAATVLDPKAEVLHEATRPARFAVLFGSEGHGLAPEWIAACHRKLTIPMLPGSDSLNVSVAAGLFLYALTRPGAFDGEG